MTTGLALVGALTAFGAFATYLSTIPRGRVPARPVGTMVFEIIAVVLVAASLALSLRGDGTLPLGVVVPSAVALSIAGLFFFLLSQRKIYIAFPYVRLLCLGALAVGLVTASYSSLLDLNAWLMALLSSVLIAAAAWVLNRIPTPDKVREAEQG